jgi:uncharacterized protein YjbI with pentapeptide repeats
MSEQAQPQGQRPTWGDDINDERKAELDAMVQAWEADHSGRDGPFQDVSLTGADVFYLAARVLVGADGDVAEAMERLRRARGDTVLRGTLDLSGLDLIGALLTGASLRDATLTQADLRSARLTGADLSYATLTDANLRDATLTQADLHRATLIRTSLENAKLKGATLVLCRMDAATTLIGIELDSHTRLGDIVWNGAPPTQVDWSQAPRLGDEDAIAKAKTHADRIAALRDATRAYRGLTTALRSQSLALPASRYRLHEQRLERRASRLERHYGAWFFSWLLDLVSGYGEEPGRIFAAYLVVVLGFAAAFMGVTHFLETGLSALRPDEALVLSLTSFHGRGFFPGFLQLGDWVARLGAAEAAIGLFIELILIATFSRRFLGN